MSPPHDPPGSSLSQQVYQRLRLSLMAGRYPPNTRLNIRHLAAELGTSTTPVREAIVQLAREQALEIRPGHQPRVPMPKISHYLAVREVRAPLERLAAELAAVRMADAEIDELAALHQRYIDNENSADWIGALSANQSLHFLVYRASGNSVLTRTLENFWLIAGPFIARQYPTILNARTSPHPHELLIEALRRRDAAEAGEALMKDLRDGSHRLLSSLTTADTDRGAQE